MSNRILRAARVLKEKFRRGNPSILGERKIHLHLGAHKTATTFIQKILRKNQETLLENGVLYLPLVETRSKLSKHISAISKVDRDPSSLACRRQAILDALGPERLERCHTILISDENLSATPNRFRNGSVYSSIAADWKHLRDELGPNISLFFSIRDYPDFLTSIYVETLRKHPYRSFEEFRRRHERLPKFWSQVHRGFSSVLGGENLNFWDFRDTIAKPAEVLAMLTGTSTPLVTKSTPVRESLSKEAIGFIRDFQSLEGRPLPPRHVTEMAMRLYPLSKCPEKFNPWSPEERATLREHYLAEKTTIPIRTF